MKLMYLNECTLGDLIRFRTEDDGSRFAIVGKRDRNVYFPIAVLSGIDAPFLLSAMINGQTLDNFETYPVLNYGREYEIIPGHRGECEIGNGQLLGKKGSYVLAGEEPYLVVGKYRQQGVRYFNPLTGDAVGEPGGMIAVFKTWSLNMSGLQANAPSLEIVKNSAA